MSSRIDEGDSTVEDVDLLPADAVLSTDGFGRRFGVVKYIATARSFQMCFDRKDEVVLGDGLTHALLSRCKPKRDERLGAAWDEHLRDQSSPGAHVSSIRILATRGTEQFDSVSRLIL